MSALKYISVDDIGFLQNSINETFKDGTPLQTLIEKIVEGTVTSESFDEIIRVIKTGDNEYLTLDHRRLYCFKEALKWNRGDGKNILVEVFDFEVIIDDHTDPRVREVFIEFCKKSTNTEKEHEIRIRYPCLKLRLCRFIYFVF